MEQYVTLIVNRKDEFEVKDKVNRVSSVYGNILLFSDIEEMIKITLYNAPLEELLSIATYYVKKQSSRKVEFLSQGQDARIEASSKNIDEVIKEIKNSQSGLTQHLVIQFIDSQ